MRTQLTACPTQKHSFCRQSKWILPPSDFRAAVVLSRQLKPILRMPKINYCGVWATLNGSLLLTANRYVLSGPLWNLSYSETLHFSVILSIASSETHDWKQRLPRKGMLLSHQKECLLQGAFDKDVLFKTRKTTSELCFAAYLRFHLVECTRVYVMCVGWEVFWNS